MRYLNLLRDLSPPSAVKLVSTLVLLRSGSAKETWNAGIRRTSGAIANAVYAPVANTLYHFKSLMLDQRRHSPGNFHRPYTSHSQSVFRSPEARWRGRFHRSPGRCRRRRRHDRCRGRCYVLLRFASVFPPSLVFPLERFVAALVAAQLAVCPDGGFGAAPWALHPLLLKPCEDTRESCHQ